MTPGEMLRLALAAIEGDAAAAAALLELEATLPPPPPPGRDLGNARRAHPRRRGNPWDHGNAGAALKAAALDGSLAKQVERARRHGLKVLRGGLH